MRRALVALAIVAVVAFAATPAVACSPAISPLSIQPVAGSFGTTIHTSAYCNRAGSATLGFPTRSDALQPPVDSVSWSPSDNAFRDVELHNNYAPPIPPGAAYFFDMEVLLRCGDDAPVRVPFLATENSTGDPGSVFTVPGDGPCGYGLAATEAEARIPCPANVRGFNAAGAASTIDDYYATTEGWGGTIAVGKPVNGRPGLAVGAGPDADARVLSSPIGGFEAYPYFRGGVNVAVGDVDGDGVDDVVTGAGPGGGPHVEVWKGHKEDAATCGQITVPALSSGWYAYDPAFAGGVSVAAADLDGDGRAEIITGALAGGGPHVRVWDEFGHRKGEFMAYDPNFHGGVNVAAADLIGDGRSEIVTGAGPGGGPHVRVFDADGSALTGFYAYAPEWTGGVFVAAGHPTPTAGKASVVTGAGAGGGPHVRVVDAQGTGGGGFYAYQGVPAGVRVAVGP